MLAHAPLRASETDTSIEESTKKSYVFRTYFLDDAIKTQAKDGVVTLTGSVNEDSHKQMAWDTVCGLPGVKSVINEIVVKNEMTVATAPQQPEQSIAEMIDDASISAQGRMALMSHRSTSVFKTTVAALEGVGTVGGSAKNAAEIDLVTKLVPDINGVKSVVNNMIVAAAVNTN